MTISEDFVARVMNMQVKMQGQLIVSSVELIIIYSCRIKVRTNVTDLSEK
jgi:hypothetical protein